LSDHPIREGFNASRVSLNAEQRAALMRIRQAPVDSYFLREPLLARLYNIGFVKDAQGFLFLTEAGERACVNPPLLRHRA
jgi:hypothetical protein